MKTFLYIDLSTSSETPYGQPVLVWAKQNLPEIALLDLDTHSGEVLQYYALRLLQEAQEVVVCIRSEAEAADFRKLMPLVEELLQPQPGRLLLLHGTNPRLLRMLQARPQLKFSVVEDEEQLQEEVLRYFYVEN